MEIVPYVSIAFTVFLIAACDGVSVLQFFSDIPEEILNFFILDCKQQSLNEARSVFRELRDQIADRKVDLITVPWDRRELKPLIYTKTIEQMTESLESYACSSHLLEDPSTTYESPDSVILSLIPQLHPRDGIILFESVINLTNPSLSAMIQRKLKPKGNQVHLLHRENTHISAEYQDLIRLTWGQVITYGYNDRTFSFRLDENNDNYNNNNNNNNNRDVNLIQNSAQPNYTVSVAKHLLEQDTRTEITLPAGTFRIFINIHGTIRKALLLSATGKRIIN